MVTPTEYNRQIKIISLDTAGRLSLDLTLYSPNRRFGVFDFWGLF